MSLGGRTTGVAATALGTLATPAAEQRVHMERAMARLRQQRSRLADERDGLKRENARLHGAGRG